MPPKSRTIFCRTMPGSPTRMRSVWRPRLVDVERRFVDGAVAQHAFEPHLRVFDVRRGGGGQCPVVDLDAVLGVGVRVFADAEIAVGVEREGRQHVGVDIDRTGVEGVEVVFGARDVAAAEDLERGGRVAQLQRGAFDARGLRRPLF